MTSLTSASGTVMSLWHAGSAIVEGTMALLAWLSDHLILVCLAAAAALGIFEAVRTHLADKASRKRTAYRLEPSRTFEPDAEQIWRYAALLTRAAARGKWWVPQRSRSARIRMTADGYRALDFCVEAPAGAAKMLATSPYRGVKITRTRPAPPARKALETVRAEFVVRGSPAKSLRAVPLDPDPLQPLVDALSGVRADLGDRVEICLDMQRIPVWQLWLTRWRLLAEARRQALKHARQDQNATAVLEDGWRAAMANLFTGDSQRHNTRWMMPPRPRPVDRDKVLGKLQAPGGLMRIQLLVRCTSNKRGNAEEHLAQISAALDVFAGTARLVHTGQRLGPLRIGPDHRLLRKGWDKRWATAQIKGHPTWVRADEVAGLLKPPTAHCVLPVMPSEVPTYVPGSPEAAELMVQGWYTGPDGVDRLIGSPLGETLFSVRVGKATYGKTMMALCQFVALAHAGGGGMFVDPHGDAIRDAARYLAHDPIMERMLLVDLTGRAGGHTQLGTWNPLSLERTQRPDEVARSVIDAIAGTLGWNDSTHPRALTVLTKAVEALVKVNIEAVGAKQPQRQATLFQIRALLTDPVWRRHALRVLDAEAQNWWTKIFPSFPPEAYAPVINPLERLYANPVTRAFLGSPTSSFDFREAMDSGKLIWICPSASGPTDRLLLSLMFADFFRAGLSRRDVPEEARRPFHAFVDELISIDSASSSIIAQVSEELRKFRVRLHAMTQLLQRVSAPTRESLLQNASVISSTAGSYDAVNLVAKEWGGSLEPVDIARLPRFHHYLTLTNEGRRVGPLLVRGPQLAELFSDLAESKAKVRALRAAADANVGALPQKVLCEVAEKHDAKVGGFLKLRKPSRKDAQATKNRQSASNSGQPAAGEGREAVAESELPHSQTDA